MRLISDVVSDACLYDMFYAYDTLLRLPIFAPMPALILLLRAFDARASIIERRAALFNAPLRYAASAHCLLLPARHAICHDDVYFVDYFCSLRAMRLFYTLLFRGAARFAVCYAAQERFLLFIF